MFVNVQSTELFKIGHQFIRKKIKKVQTENGFKSPDRKKDTKVQIEKRNKSHILVDKGNKNPNKKEIEKSNGQWI